MEQSKKTSKVYYKKVPRDQNRSRLRAGYNLAGGVECNRCFALKLKLDESRAENVRLKAALKIAQKVTHKDIAHVHTPSSRIAYKKNSSEQSTQNKGGARVGHLGTGREAATRESADRVIETPRPLDCPECKCSLNQRDYRERTILEALPVKAEKILYRLGRGICPKCLKVYSSKPKALPKTLYGNRLIAQAATMHFVHGITIGKVLSILGKQVTEGGLIDAFHRLGKICEKAVPHLIEDYRQSEVKHADETGWRTDGQSGYAWVFTSPETSIFNFADSRAAKVARNVLGTTPLPGVLVVDRYGGYNQMPCKLQYCYAHLLREVEKLEEEFSDESEVISFVAQLATALSEAMKLRSLPIEDAQYYERANELQSQIEKIVGVPAKHLGIKRIQEIFLDKKQRLYHWVQSRNVPPDNNRAERELRPTVVARKVSFGSQSERGAKTRSSIMSVLFTAKKRFKDQAPEDWLKTALDRIAENSGTQLISLLQTSTPGN